MLHEKKNNTSSRHIVVTGAGGFIGQHLVARLAADGHRVDAIVRNRAKGLDKASRIIPMDLIRYPLPKELVTDETILIHLAARVGGAAQACPAEESDTANIARHVAEAKPRRLVTLSSIAASIAERTPNKARRYGLEKAAADKILQQALDGCNIVTLRPPSIYGREMIQGPVGTLSTLVKKGIPLPLAAATAPRPYLSVDNLTSLIARLVSLDYREWEALGRAPIEFHDGQQVSTRDLIRFIADIHGVSARLFPVPLPLLRLAGRLAGRVDLISGAIEPVHCEMSREDLDRIGWAPGEQIPDSLRSI